METRSTLIFAFCISAFAKVKPPLKSLDPNPNLQGANHLDLDFFQKIRLIFRVGKKTKQNGIFLGSCHPHPLFFKMSQDFDFSDSCTQVHVIEEETKVQVPGTWI